MIKNFTLLFFLFASLTLNAQNINIPDANFKKALVDNPEINTDGDAEISESEAIAFTGEINVSDKEIADLTGIEYFTSVTSLICYNNQLTQLDISKNIALIYLDCWKNQVTHLDVSNNTALSTLKSNSNQFTLLDISKNTALTTLWCQDNQLTQLDLSKNTALTHLYCYENQLTQLDVSKNTALNTLWCQNNQLTQLDLDNNLVLTSLSCHTNPLNSLDISKNVTLIYLNCWKNQLTHLDVSNNSDLSTLKCDSNQIIQLDLSKNTALNTLWCHINQLNTLDISKNTALTELICDDNKFPLSEVNQIKTHFTDLSYTSDKTIFTDLSKKVGETIDYSAEKEFNDTNTTFSWYNSSDDNAVDETFVKETDTKGVFKFLKEGIYYCKMANATLSSSELKTESISVTDPAIVFSDANFKAALLTHSGLDSNGDGEIQYSEALAYTGYINVSDKSIANLTGIEYFINITSLKCYNNQLTQLDVSTNTALTTLWCSQNQLSQLDVSHNTALIYLYCSKNKLTQLVVNTNTALTEFQCWDNQLSQLDVSNNIALTKLGCSLNQLTQLDVSKNTALTKLWSNDNQLSALDITKNTILTHLYCYKNQLTQLDVTKNIALNTLWCQNNQLTQLDLDNNLVLNSLSCHTNPLKTLDISKNTTLIYLNCWKNQLTHLDVSNNSDLTTLKCDSNQLIQLDLSKNTALNTLWCHINQLNTLDISENTALTELICDDNKFPLSKVNQIKTNFTDLSYTSDKTIFTDLSKKVGETIDYSAEKEFNDTNTTFSWYNSSDDNAVDETFVKETDTKGVFEFLKEGIYYCKMANATLSSSELKTESISVTDPAIVFSDANFKAALLTHSGLDSNGDGEIQYSEALAYTGYINVSDKSIANLTGIEYFINITSLKCYNNQLTQLDVSTNTALTTLWCSQNQLSQLDVSHNTALIYLYCSKNKLTQLVVNTNTALTEFQCWDNQLSQLDVSNNIALTKLGCSLNQLTQLDVSKNTALTKLWSNDNQLSALDITKNTILTHLYCFKNQLTQLDVTKNTALIHLDCYDNPLRSLDVTKNTALNILGCTENQLTQLDVSQNTDLTHLYCYKNQLTQLDVSNNKALIQLDCYQNQLKQLDLTKNSALNILGCTENKLTQLDVSHNTALTHLYCWQNQLTQLNVSNNKALTVLDCYDNYFSLSEINQTKTYFVDLVYTSDRTIFTALSKKVGETIDYSTEKKFYDTNTTFSWYNSSDNSIVDETFVKETDTQGVFEFLKAGTYHCKMANATLTSSELKTEVITVEKQTQTVEFVNAPTTAKVNDVITLNANASSTLPISFSIVSGTATLVDDQLTCTTEGTIQVKATQVGNDEFESAEAVIEITVSKKDQSIAFVDAPTTTKVNDVITLITNASSTLPVSFSILSGTATLNGDQLTCTTEGIIQVKATQAGNEEFEAAEAIIEITVSKKEQTIAFIDIPATAKVKDLITLVADASSTLPVSFSIVSGTATLVDDQLTCTTEGTIQVKATQIGNEEFETAEAIIEITVEKRVQTIEFTNTPIFVKANEEIQLYATASSGLNVTFELVSGIADIIGNSITFNEVGTVEIKAVQEGNEEYEACEKTIGITVDYATGIEDVLETSTQIYPNPVETEMIIKFSNSEEKTIRIFDLQGRLKLQMETSSTSERLNLSNFKSGMYLMKVQAKNESSTFKIIKK